MEAVQVIFLLTFVGMIIVTYRLWRLYRDQPMRGMGWWLCGCLGMTLTALMVLVTPYVGVWTLSVVAHIVSIGGFCAIWIGARLFFGIGSNGSWRLFFFAFLSCLGLVFYWFGYVDPQYQVRLTINCVFLLLFSMAISQVLFSARVRLGPVTVGGVLFMVFALINGFRTINIILFPATGSVYRSDGFSRMLTVLMLPVLLAALGTLEFLVRTPVDSNAEVEE